MNCSGRGVESIIRLWSEGDFHDFRCLVEASVPDTRWRWERRPMLPPPHQALRMCCLRPRRGCVYRPAQLICSPIGRLTVGRGDVRLPAPPTLSTSINRDLARETAGDKTPRPRVTSDQDQSGGSSGDPAHDLCITPRSLNPR